MGLLAGIEGNAAHFPRVLRVGDVKHSQAVRLGHGELSDDRLRCGRDRLLAAAGGQESDQADAESEREKDRPAHRCASVHRCAAI
jgi:hypothetical protein